MTHKYGLFINLDYAHKFTDDCSKIWEIIKDSMTQNGFLFEKRAFVIQSEKNSEEIANYVVQLFDQIQINSPDLHIYSYLTDCFILNLDQCKDIKQPDTSNSILVEDVNMYELDAAGIQYNTLFKK